MYHISFPLFCSSYRCSHSPPCGFISQAYIPNRYTSTVVTNLSPQTLTTHHTKWHLFFLSWKHAPNVLNIDKTTFSTQLQLSNGMQRCSCNKKKQGRVFVAFNWLLIFSIDLHNPRKKSIWFVLLVTCTSLVLGQYSQGIYIYIYIYIYGCIQASYHEQITKYISLAFLLFFFCFVTSNFNMIPSFRVEWPPHQSLAYHRSLCLANLLNSFLHF
jgi:hypothetical protein